MAGLYSKEWAENPRSFAAEQKDVCGNALKLVHIVVVSRSAQVLAEVRFPRVQSRSITLTRELCEQRVDMRSVRMEERKADYLVHSTWRTLGDWRNAKQVVKILTLSFGMDMGFERIMVLHSSSPRFAQERSIS